MYLGVLQVRRLEAAGMPREASEALAEHVTELIVMNKHKMDATFVSRQELEKVRPNICHAQALPQWDWADRECRMSPYVPHM